MFLNKTFVVQTHSTSRRTDGFYNRTVVLPEFKRLPSYLHELDSVGPSILKLDSNRVAHRSTKRKRSSHTWVSSTRHRHCSKKQNGFFSRNETFFHEYEPLVFLRSAPLIITPPVGNVLLKHGRREPVLLIGFVFHFILFRNV